MNANTASPARTDQPAIVYVAGLQRMRTAQDIDLSWRAPKGLADERMCAEARTHAMSIVADVLAGRMSMDEAEEMIEHATRPAANPVFARRFSAVLEAALAAVWA